MGCSDVSPPWPDPLADSSTATTFRSLAVGETFRIVNTNFTPPKTMPTVCTKLSDTTYSWPRPRRSDCIDRLRSEADDFPVVLVASPSNP